MKMLKCRFGWKKLRNFLWWVESFFVGISEWPSFIVNLCVSRNNFNTFWLKILLPSCAISVDSDCKFSTFFTVARENLGNLEVLSILEALESRILSQKSSIVWVYKDSKILPSPFWCFADFMNFVSTVIST